MYVILFVVFIDLLGFGIIIPLLPFYAERFGADPFVATMLMATYSGCQIISAPLWGRLSDRIGRRPVVLISVSSSVIAYFAMGFANSLTILFAARALQGLSAGNISVAQAYMADISTPENRAKYMGMLGAMLGLGFTLGPPLGGILAGSDPHTSDVVLPSYVASAFSLVALIGAVLTLKESLPLEKRRMMPKQPSRINQLRDAFSRPRLSLLMVLFFTTTFAFAGMETTFGLYAEHRYGWGPKEVGYVFLLVGVVLVLVQGGLIRVMAKKLGEPKTLLIGTVLIGIGLGMLAISYSVLGAVIATILLASGMGMVSPAISTLVSREATAFEQGSILGVNQSVGSFARFTGPALAGVLFKELGAGAPYFSGAALMLVSTFLAIKVLRQAPPALEMDQPIQKEAPRARA